MLWLPSGYDQVSPPFRFLCLYYSITYVCQYVVRHLKNICHFIVINGICHTNEKNCWHKFYKSFNKILQNYDIYMTILCLTNENKLKSI